ncbi:hypothetical protein [Enterobacter soli]|uniref:hypothetical protein n=1 Tax=Enterobacter soli TaxID=885040 RepID=UPI0034CFB08F
MDDMAYLSDEQKAEAKDAIQSATTVPDVEQAVADAAAQNLDAAKAEAAQAVDDMAYLSDEQKAEAKDAIQAATTVPGVEQALADAAAQNLDAAKAEAAQAVDDMAYLSDEQKAEAKDAIQAATTVPGVEQALADAAAQNLDAAKAEATQAVDDMAYLSDEQKTEAKEAIQAASTVPDVEKALADAEKDNLQSAKDDANKAIDDMAYLSDEQKDNAHQAVNDATDVAGVEQAVADASSLNHEDEPSFLDSLFNMVGNFVGGIWDVIIAIPKGILEALKSVISLLGDYHFSLESGPAALTGVALIAWEAIVEVIHAPLSFLSNLVQWITGFTTGLLAGVWGPLGLIPHILNGILIIVDGIFNTAKIIIESIGVGVITIPGIITGAIAWVITLSKGIGAVLSGDSSAMEDFISALSESLSKNPLIPLILGDIFVAIMVIPKLAVEGISVVAEWILGIITGFLQVIPGLIPVASVVSDFPLAIDGVVIAIHYGLSSVVNLITKLGMALIMGIPIGISTGTSLVAIVESFVKGLLGITSDEDIASNPVNDIIDNIIAFIESPISGTGDLISSILGSIGQFFSNPIGAIGDFIQGAIDLILSPFKGIIDAIGSVFDFITSPLGGIGDIFNGIMEGIGNILGNPFGAIGDIFQGVIDLITTPFKGIIDAVGSVFDFIMSPFETVGNIIGGVMEGIGNILGNPFGAVGDIFQGIIDLILSPFKGIMDIVNSVIGVVLNPVDAILGLIGDPVGMAWNFMTNPVGTITDLINNVIDTVLSPFKGIIDFVGSLIYDVTHPLETISNIFNNIIGMIFGGSSGESAEEVVEAYNTVIDNVETAVDNFVESPATFVLGENTENTLTMKDLVEISATLDTLAGSADTNVVSLTAMDEAQPSLDASLPAVNEELTDGQIASLLEENQPGEIDLDSLIGAETDLVVAETNTPDAQNSVEDTGGYNVLDKIISQLQLSEDNYNLAAA